MGPKAFEKVMEISGLGIQAENLPPNPKTLNPKP